METEEVYCNGDGAILGTDCGNFVDVRKYTNEELSNPETLVLCDDCIEQEAYEYRQESARDLARL